MKNTLAQGIACVCRILTSAWRHTARLHIRETAHGIVTAARGKSFLNVQISHPFGRQKLLRIFTEIEKAAIQNFTTTLWRDSTVISAPSMERIDELHQRREMHCENKESRCCSFTVPSRSPLCALGVTKRLHILQLLDVFERILVLFSL